MRELAWRNYLSALLFFFTSAVYAQLTTPDLLNPDSLIGVAQSYAEERNYDACREICFSVLSNYPHYNDFRIIAGRTLAWENKSDSAKAVIEPILNIQPYNKEALLALADIEMWRYRFEEALVYVDTGLVEKPDDIDLLDKRAEILQKMASKAPKNPISYGTLYPDSNAVGLMYYFEFFKKPYIARRHMISVQYMKITSLAPFSVRFNVGDNVLDNEYLFKNPSYQIEMDAYPKIDQKSYLYLNYGIGNGAFFPSHRAGLEYFKGLNNGFEVSAGTRYMYWEHSITFLTGSVAKYLDAYWLAFRPFFSMENNNFSDAYLFEARRYFGVYNSYLFGLVIFGDSPDQPLSLAQEYGNFKSMKYSIGIQHRVYQWQISTDVGFQREEFWVNKTRNRFDFRIGASYVF